MTTVSAQCNSTMAIYFSCVQQNQKPTPTAYCSKCESTYNEVVGKCTGDDLLNPGIKGTIVQCSKVNGEYCGDIYDKFRANLSKFECNSCTGFYLSSMVDAAKANGEPLEKIPKDQQDCAAKYKNEKITPDSSEPASTQAADVSSSFVISVAFGGSLLHWL